MACSVKTCRKCGHSKPLVEMVSAGKDKWATLCKLCRKAHERARYAASKAVVTNNRRKMLKSKWGMEPADFDRMLAEQGGACAVCSGPTKAGHHYCIDHCHTTGKIRGLLCHDCNMGIGKLGDTAASVAKALAYLNEFEQVLQCSSPK